MAKDVDHHQQPHGNDNNSGNNHGVIVTDGANASGPLQPVLKFDVSSLDDTISSALIEPDIRSRETLFTLYCLLYDRVSIVQSDERKQTLVYAELCKRLKQMGFVEILPQIDTLRTFHQNYKSHLENLISEISSDIDKRFTSLDIEIADLFCRNSSLPTTKSSKSNFVRLNVHQHRLLNDHPPNPGSYNTSRAKDFINCGLIAKGGFGSVYRMQNVTDKCVYAIKAIPFKSRNQVDASKIMNEVYFAAALPSHQNIVCYKSSWLDHYVKVYGTEKDTMVNEENFGSTEFLSSSSSGSSPPKKDSTVDPIIEEIVDYQSVNSEISNENLLSHTSSQLSSESSSSSSLQPHSTNESQKSASSSSSDGLTIEFIDNESSSQQDQQEDSNSDSKPNQTYFGGDQLVLTTKSNKPPLYYCVLFIQMELCSYNLRAWIDLRNEDIYHKKVESIDYEKAIDIFMQIVKGVHHLHTHNLIHRDIKPHNILFSESGVVKIGDFGLTTFNANVEVQEDETLAWSGEAQNLTQGLGTSSYSAPEQQNTTSYNYKADIYSLGLIALELLYPLFTDMERSDRFDKLKSDKLLPEELTKYQPFADLILETVQNDSSARPDTKTILEKESLLRRGWKINSDKQSYEDLIQINRHLNEKILKLEETIQLKDSEIEQLKERLKEQKD